MQRQELLLPVRGIARFTIAIPQGRATVELDVGSGPDALREIHYALDNFWSLNAHVPVAIRIEIDIAVTEVAANIIEHARASRLTLAIQVRPNEVEVEFTDPGAPAEIDLASLRMPDAMAGRGRGLAMTKLATREVSYSRDGRGNHWRIVSKEF